jgi:hypothetical protein
LPNEENRGIEEKESEKGSLTQHQNKLVPLALVVTFHPNNPPFQSTINSIWARYEQILSKLISKPLVAYRRPPNLKDLLTKARYGKPAISTARDPTQTVSNRPMSTYDRNQMMAPIKFVIFKCTQHYELHEKFKSMVEAQDSPQYTSFAIAHEKCGQVRLLPADATHLIVVKCTECKFNEKITTGKQINMLTTELRNICDTTQKALHRPPPIHNTCRSGCKTCTLLWQSQHFEDHGGTRYRLMPFDCKVTNVVYIIHCQLCKINYVGLTSTKLRQRISNHLSCIRNWRRTSVAVHFMQQNHNVNEHFKIGIIDVAPNNITNLRIREGFWIHALQTVSKGINQREESNLILNHSIINVAKHFRHSLTCSPYIIPTLKDVFTDDLKQYKRVIIAPKTRRTASAPKTDRHDQRSSKTDVRRTAVDITQYFQYCGTRKGLVNN